MRNTNNLLLTIDIIMADFREQIVTLIDSMMETNTISDGQRVSLLNAVMRIGNGEFINASAVEPIDDTEPMYKLHIHLIKMQYNRDNNKIMMVPTNVDFDFYTPLTASEYDLIRDTIYHDGYYEFQYESEDWFNVGGLFSNREIHTILPDDEFKKGILFEQDRQLVRVYHINLLS